MNRLAHRSVKMSRLQAESVINTIIGEIVKECAQRGQVVSETLGAFMVKAVLLDTRNGFDVNRSLTEQDVQNLQQLCVEKLTEKCSPALNTIQMQLYFDQNYTSRREFLKEIHQVLESRLSLVSREITDSRAKTMKDLDALYHQIVTYILLRSGLGSPTDTKIVQEATADLQSIFLQKDLEAFLVLLKKDKEHMLKELTMLVTGIRLFNEASKRTEDFNIQELMPSSLKEALPVTGKCVIAELNGTQSLVWKYTAVLDKLTHPHIQSRQCDVPIVLLKQALYNIRQHEGFLKILQTDVCLCTKHIDILQMELFSQLKLLRETVQSKTAVPSASVFPLFRAISKLWSELQDEASLLNILSKITLSLKPFAISQTMFSEKYLDSLLEASEIKTDEQRMAESSDQQIDLIQLNTHEWLLPETISNFDELPLQYNGFCSYTFVTRDGLILPGNPCIGVLKHKEKLYAFSSKEAALKFASCPDKFVTEVVEKSKCFPELFQLLRVYQQLPRVSPDSKIVQGETSWVMPLTRCDSSTQTDIHPVKTNINKSYKWNEWELRRNALKLADLRTKVNCLVQTDFSQMRRENITQTWLLKDAACQSKTDCGSNMAKVQTFLAGLRGHLNAPMIKINLTKPVDE